MEVRPVEEILATLDADGCLDRLPFMPEMLQYAGKRFRVLKSAHKTCDTIDTYTIRRMSNAVHLEDLRCDGIAHGGCQAACLLFWKDDWLRRVESSESESPAKPNRASTPTLSVAALEAFRKTTRLTPAEGETEERFRCQATELVRASEEVRRRDRWSPRFYLQDLTSGNVTLRDFLQYGLLALINVISVRILGRRYPHVCGLAGARTPTSNAGLEAGDLVQVRSKEEIMETLNSGMRNRGLWFDVEMVRYCGTTQRVRTKVERVIDEKTGRMLHMQTPSVILDGVVCSGTISMYRMFCPRGIYSYWREIWLEPLPGSAGVHDESSSTPQGGA